ncbi:MAG: iron-containing alcohol dehydrogenase [Verrucomicrobiales bacterium]
MRASSTITADGLCEGLGAPEDVVCFAHAPGTEVVFGPGVIARVGEVCSQHGGSRVLLVTDHGILKAGHAARVVELLEEAGHEVTIFADAHENPTTDDVDNCARVARHAQIDLIVGLGGGSSMDTGKGCNFILSGGGEIKDYQGKVSDGMVMLPFVAVPTTAGTGSECQSFALIADTKTHMKMACGNSNAAAKVAILDPELTLTQSPSVTAHTGIDALTHAIESAVTSKRTGISSEYAKLAFALLDSGLEMVIKDPDNLDARARVQLGAAYAGTAIENSMLGAAHAAANPLTARFGIVHGQAVGVMMPGVIRFNAELGEIDRIYRELYDGDLAARMTDLLKLAGMSVTVDGHCVNREDIAQLAAEAAAQWTAGFNPRAVAESDFEGLYEGVLPGTL